jgi:hypothetical protein
VTKLTLTDLTNLENQSGVVASINANMALIETAVENTLSRDGTSPNTMSANLDMNNYRITNLPEPVDDTDPVRVGDLLGTVVDAEAAAEEANTSAAAAAASAAAASASASAAASSASAADTSADNALASELAVEAIADTLMSDFETYADAEAYEPEAAPESIHIRGHTASGDYGDSFFAEEDSEPVGAAGNLIYDPDFSSVTDDTQDETAWVAGANWAIADGKATHTAGSTAVLSQSQPQYGTPPYDRIVEEESYKISVYVTGRTAGTVTPRFTGGTTVTGTAISANGLNEQTLVAVVGNNVVELLPSSAFDGSISSVHMTLIKSLPDNAKMQITLSDAVTTAWYRRKPTEIRISMTGAPARVDDPANVAATSTAIQEAVEWAWWSGAPVQFLPGLHYVSAFDTENTGLIHTLGQTGDKAAKPSSLTIRGVGLSTILKNITDEWGAFIALDEGENICISDLVLDGNYPEYGSTTGGHGVLTSQNGIIRRLRLNNLWIKNTYSYGIGLQNSDLIDAVLSNITITNAGDDGIDIKAREGARTHRKHAIRLSNILVDGFNSSAVNADRAGIDIRGHILANGLYVQGFAGGLVGGDAGVRLNADSDVDNDRKGSRKSQVSNVYVLSTTDAADVAANGNRGIVVWDEFVNVSNAVVEGCAVGLLVDASGDSVPVGIGLNNITVIGARTSDGAGSGFKLDSTNGVESISLNGIAQDCDIGITDGTTGWPANVYGDITLRGCDLGHDLTAGVLATGSLVMHFDSNVLDNNLGHSYPVRGENLLFVANSGPVLESHTALELGDIADVCNTTNKVAGMLVRDSTNNAVRVAAGSATNAVWWLADGSSGITPA